MYINSWSLPAALQFTSLRHICAIGAYYVDCVGFSCAASLTGWLAIIISFFFSQCMLREGHWTMTCHYRRCPYSVTKMTTIPPSTQQQGEKVK